MPETKGQIPATTPVIERAIERGELPANSDATLIIETLVEPVWLRLLLTGEPIDDEVADRLAALVSADATNI